MQQLINLDSQTDRQTEQYYDDLMSYIRDHLMAFYQQYADENSLSLSETMARVSKWDIDQWKSTIDSLGDTSDWPQEAKDRLKAQALIASINRQFLIGSILAIGIIHTTVKNQKAIKNRVNSDGKDEVKRLTKSLKLPRKQVKRATSIITQASTREQWSSNLWVDSDKLAADVQYLVNQNLKHGLSLDDLPMLLNKHANPNQFNPKQSVGDRIEQLNYETKRLVRTESARLKYETDITTFRMQGVKWVKWLTEPGACSICQGIADGGPYAIDDVPEIPGDSHPNCRCSIVAYYGWPVPMKQGGYTTISDSFDDVSEKTNASLWNADTGYIQTDNAFRLNSVLRGTSSGTLSQQDEETIKLLDDVISTHKAPRTLTAVRFVGSDFMNDLVDQIKPTSNEEFLTALNTGKFSKSDKGFTSVSLSSNNLFLNRPVKLTIVIPKGTSMFVTNNSIESEAILARNTKYAILKAKINGKRQLEVLIRPRKGGK